MTRLAIMKKNRFLFLLFSRPLSVISTEKTGFLPTIDEQSCGGRGDRALISQFALIGDRGHFPVRRAFPRPGKRVRHN